MSKYVAVKDHWRVGEADGDTVTLLQMYCTKRALAKYVVDALNHYQDDAPVLSREQFDTLAEGECQ